MGGRLSIIITSVLMPRLSHRNQWIYTRLIKLTNVFAGLVGAHALWGRELSVGVMRARKEHWRCACGMTGGARVRGEGGIRCAGGYRRAVWDGEGADVARWESGGAVGDGKGSCFGCLFC